MLDQQVDDLQAAGLHSCMEGCVPAWACCADICSRKQRLLYCFNICLLNGLEKSG
jgi:hypothetical protein